jgi:hypothetical protein
MPPRTPSAFASLALALALALLLPASTQAVEVEGRVTDQAGQPLQGATVYAYDLRLGYEKASTDEDGSYRITGLPAGLYRLRAVPGSTQHQVARAWPEAWSFCDGSLIELGDEPTTGLDFELPDGALLRGALVDPQGEPLAGGLVTARGADSTTTGLARQAVSDLEGRFEIPGLDVPVGDVALWTCEVELSGWPDQLLEGVYDDEEADIVEIPHQGEQDLGQWSLTPGVGAAGSVMGPDGPVQGASVHVYASSQVVTVGSDEDGLYEAWAVPPGSMLTWASADGLATTYWPDSDRPQGYLDVLEEGALQDGFDLTLPTQATLRGQLISEADLGDVTVLLYNDAHTVGRGALVEPDGSFVIDKLHEGAYQLYIYAADEGHLDDWWRDEGGEPAWIEVDGARDNELGLIVPPVGAWLEGRVTDQQGAPVYGAYVYASERGGEIVEVTSTDRDGRFSIPGLVAGSWQLEVRYVAYCGRDPGYVTSYWEGQVYEARASFIELEEGGGRAGLDFTLPQDDDHDQMADDWEEEYGLDTGRDDASEDPDGDGYTNLEEYHLGTDPLAAWEDPSGPCGCRRGSGGVGALALLLPWGLRRRYPGRSTHSA